LPSTTGATAEASQGPVGGTDHLADHL
jgi:hypothetical protein